MDKVFDALLARLEGQPPGQYVVLGVAPGGHELRAARRVRPAVHLGPGDVIPPHVSLCIELPEAPRGVVEHVLVRWSDALDTTAYHSLSDDATRPDWTQIKPTRHGLRLCVRWSKRERVRKYDFAWTTEMPRP